VYERNRDAFDVLAPERVELLAHHSRVWSTEHPDGLACSGVCNDRGIVFRYLEFGRDDRLKLSDSFVHLVVSGDPECPLTSMTWSYRKDSLRMLRSKISGRAAETDQRLGAESIDRV